MFHLGWFTNFMPPKSRRTHWGGRNAEEWAKGSFTSISPSRLSERVGGDLEALRPVGL